jgi:hypothetical protein
MGFILAHRDFFALATTKAEAVLILQEEGRHYMARVEQRKAMKGKKGKKGNLDQRLGPWGRMEEEDPFKVVIDIEVPMENG